MAQMPWFLDEISKVEALLACFESHEDVLLDWDHQRRDASAQWHKYASSYNPLIRRLFEASGRIKSKLFRRRLFGSYESSWVWLRMECVAHVMSHAPCVVICKCAASKIVRLLSSSSSCEIGPSVLQVMSSIAS